MSRRPVLAVDRGLRPLLVLAAALVASAQVARPVPALAVPFAYVANHGDGNVTVIDTATNQVVATVTVGNQPLGVTVDASGTRAYVANQVTPSGTVSVIDTTQNGVIGTVTTGAGPSGVAAKLPGDRLYVTNRDDKNVAVVDTATLAVVTTVAVGNNPLGIAVDPAGTPAYVVNKGSNSVSVIDTNANAVVATIPVGNDPTHVAVSPSGDRAYVANASNASVSVIDTAKNAVVATVAVGNIPAGVAVDPAGARVYVANSGPNNVSVIDTATNTVLTTVTVGTTPEALAFRTDGARLYVANRQGTNVSVIDTASNAVMATVDAGTGPTGLGSFIAPALLLPRFDAAARTCQARVARDGAKLAKTHLALAAACELGRIKAEASGKGTAKAEAACLKALDLANPLSKLAKAHAKLRTSFARKCAAVAPRRIHGPCQRDALTFADTADCLLAQHATHVAAMHADAFSPTRPVPLAGGARTCQSAISKQGRRLADRGHRELGKCLEKLLAVGQNVKRELATVAACRTVLDLANPLSKMSVARTKALAGIVAACAGRSPADLGSPCDGAATTTVETATCIVDGHLGRVAKLVAGEFNDACPMLTRLGLAPAYPAVCTGR